MKKILKSYAEPFILIIIWFMIFVYADSFGKIEARYNPVIDNVKVELIDRGDGTSDLWLYYDKVRDCNYEDIKFQLVSNNDGIERTSNLEAEFEGREAIRGKGAQRAGNWIINAPISELSNIRFETVHECHGLYQTVSAFEYKNGVVSVR